VGNRTFHILCELQREFDVHLLAFSRRNHQPDADARAASSLALEARLSRVYDAAPINAERTSLARGWCHLRSLATARPYTYYEYSSRTFGNTLRQVLARLTPDLVHFDSLDLYRWLTAVPLRPIAVTHHSVESDLLRSRAQHIRPPWVRPYLRLQAGWLESVERRYCPQVALNVMMSEPDAKRLGCIAPQAQTVTIPNGVDLEYFRPARDPVAGNQVVFLGPTYMYPNLDAVQFFLTEVWGNLRSKIPDAQFHVVGKMPEAVRQQVASHGGVSCHGYLPDIRSVLGTAACSVVPIRIGGGTRLKILDSWAMGKAVVSTPIGCEGLDAVDGENILIREHPDDFANAVAAVLTDETLRNRLEAGGRATVERTYSWTAIGDRLLAAYRELLGSWEGRAGAQRASSKLKAHSH
jgi:glycosyltransferase involved in cell wall biosynthesis